MKQLLKEIIADQKGLFVRRKWISRPFPEALSSSEEIIVITGVRRCGKSVLLQQIRQLQPERDYFLNFDDERLREFRVEHFQLLYEVFVELYGEQSVFYFDEIQNIAGWEHFVKRLYNSGKKVFVTGSNANMLSRELGTYLTGCYRAVELYPFSFGEYLTLQGRPDLTKEVSGTVKRGEVLRFFEEYLQKGGFPMYLRTGDPEILHTLYENILYRDVLVRNKITNERELKELMFYAVSNVGKTFTYNSLKNAVKVKSPVTAKNYVSYVSDTYLLFTVSKIDASVKEQLRSPQKFYCIDTALALHLGFRLTADTGRLLENLIYLELRRRNPDEVFYYNDGESECDFIVRRGFRVVMALQVSVSLSNPRTRQRELKGLVAALQAFDLEKGYVITREEEEVITTSDNRTLYVRSAWKWLLETDEA